MVLLELEGAAPFACCQDCEGIARIAGTFRVTAERAAAELLECAAIDYPMVPNSSCRKCGRRAAITALMSVEGPFGHAYQCFPNTGCQGAQPRKCGNCGLEESVIHPLREFQDGIVVCVRGTGCAK